MDRRSKRSVLKTSHTPLGWTVRQVAHRLHLTLREVAVRTQMARPTLYQLLSGRILPGTPAGVRLKRWLAVNGKGVKQR